MAGHTPPHARNVTRILQKLRNWLLSHDELKSTHRYEGYIAKRTQPKPNIPPGVSSKLADNYYCTRDGRREVEPPTVVYNASQKMLGEGASAQTSKAPLPGIGYNWETGKPAWPEQ
ncbi:NADP dehydrogenase [ubiquinone] 1 alpha subcomplex subunit 7 [Plakobranchus ocellatus]|uniref:NADH dehydrogenase [ubiquinone] 1 alpha subcomplex subunit 7 n=1 Tax=Plakobranchus ocellatus TaxID=259542 RepID=A0AAV3ZA52_9GAST|nr:NADP dehydrogenase [ubiquinone] 1 alpha subcomplex subunit 7 [Plakobranchus ocellatus]